MVLLAGEKPPTSISAWNEASPVMRFQNCASCSRAASRPPPARPEASSAALIAPALAPLIVSKSTPGSSSKRSITPQENAENVPPPCSASDSLRGGQTRGAGVSAGVAAIVCASDRSVVAGSFTSVTVGLSSATGFTPVAARISSATTGCVAIGASATTSLCRTALARRERQRNIHNRRCYDDRLGDDRI